MPHRLVVPLALLLAAPALADDPKAHPANRLAGETSPYLLQHAHNPVDWYPWGPEAFAKAKAEGKPIFLSVGYSACYWCHVMERECFEDEAIAKLLNAGFVCIKVDREERPDVDQVYMAALQAFGRGGWPMSMFLTPEGKPFFGGTYFPPKDREGSPGFPAVLAAVADAWRDKREQLLKDADHLTDRVRRETAGLDAARRAPLAPAMIAEGIKGLAEQFDPEHGGFNFDPDRPHRPKFPEAPNLVFLLDQAGRGGKVEGRAPLDMALTTLDHLARGGIRDHLAGGYHRYSVDRSWTVPHFEKMLYDNAQLASVFVRAFEITKDPRWRREAEATFAFVARSLTGPEGGFYSSLDAEADGEEGKTYAWTRAEVRRVLGADGDFDDFAAVYGLDGGPTFEGDRYVLRMPATLADLARTRKTTPEALDARLAPLRAKLLAARDGRPQPRLDDKVLTAWNGLMIAAYADGARVFQDDAYRRAAERAADFLLSKLTAPDGRLLRTYRAGRAKLPAYLEDYAFLVHGLLRLHAATGDPARLDQARRLADRMVADFADDEHGGFFYTADDHESLLARTKDPIDNALPSGNGVAARDLLTLAKLTGEPRYLEVAGKALDAFSPALARSPANLPTMLVALAESLDARPAASTVPPAAETPAPSGVVSARAAVLKGAEIAPGREFDVAIVLEIQDGWHVNANPVRSDTLKPTAVTLADDHPIRLVRVEYPAGVSKPLAPGREDKVDVYEGTATLRARVRVADDAAPGNAILNFRVRYQPCDDRSCLAPARLDVSLHVDIAPR